MGGGFPIDPRVGHVAGASVPSRDGWTQGLKLSPFHSHPRLALALALTHALTLTLTLILSFTLTARA